MGSKYTISLSQHRIRLATASCGGGCQDSRPCTSSEGKAKCNVAGMFLIEGMNGLSDGGDATREIPHSSAVFVPVMKREVPASQGSDFTLAGSLPHLCSSRIFATYETNTASFPLTSRTRGKFCSASKRSWGREC